MASMKSRATRHFFLFEKYFSLFFLGIFPLYIFEMSDKMDGVGVGGRGGAQSSLFNYLPSSSDHQFLLLLFFLSLNFFSSLSPPPIYISTAGAAVSQHLILICAERKESQETETHRERKKERKKEREKEREQSGDLRLCDSSPSFFSAPIPRGDNETALPSHPTHAIYGKHTHTHTHTHKYKK